MSKEQVFSAGGVRLTSTILTTMCETDPALAVQFGSSAACATEGLMNLLAVVVGDKRPERLRELMDILERQQLELIAFGESLREKL